MSEARCVHSHMRCWSKQLRLVSVLRVDTRVPRLWRAIAAPWTCWVEAEGRKRKMVEIREQSKASMPLTAVSQDQTAPMYKLYHACLDRQTGTQRHRDSETLRTMPSRVNLIACRTQSMVSCKLRPVRALVEGMLVAVQAGSSLAKVDKSRGWRGWQLISLSCRHHCRRELGTGGGSTALRGACNSTRLRVSDT